MASRWVECAGDIGRLSLIGQPFLELNPDLTVVQVCDTNGRLDAKPLLVALLGGSAPGRFRNFFVGDAWEEDR